MEIGRFLERERTVKYLRTMNLRNTGKRGARIMGNKFDRKGSSSEVPAWQVVVMGWW